MVRYGILCSKAGHSDRAGRRVEESCLGFRLGMRFRLWNRHFFSGLWLTDFGKVWLFRCQSGIRRLWLTDFGKVWLFRCQSGIRRLWLGAFGKVWHFMFQSRSFRPTLLPPLQPWFVKETAFFSAKAQKLKNSAKPNSGDCLPVFAFASGNSCLTNSFCAGAVWTFIDGAGSSLFFSFLLHNLLIFSCVFSVCILNLAGVFFL